jgi:hypothetical protein
MKAEVPKTGVNKILKIRMTHMRNSIDGKMFPSIKFKNPSPNFNDYAPYSVKK